MYYFDFCRISKQAKGHSICKMKGMYLHADGHYCTVVRATFLYTFEYIIILLDIYVKFSVYDIWRTYEFLLFSLDFI